MEPLKPHQKAAILANSPSAQPGDIDEYERLLSNRFTQDPDFAVAALAPVAGASMESAFSKSRTISSEQRLAELHEKLFGGAVAQDNLEASH